MDGAALSETWLTSEKKFSYVAKHHENKAELMVMRLFLVLINNDLARPWAIGCFLLTFHLISH